MVLTILENTEYSLISIVTISIYQNSIFTLSIMVNNIIDQLKFLEAKKLSKKQKKMTSISKCL